MTNLSTKHLLGIKDLTADDIHLILNTAENFKDVINRPKKEFLPYEILPLPIYFLKILLAPNYPSNLPKNA